MEVYKLTDLGGWTRRWRTNEHNWIEQPLLETSGEGELCTSGWVHAYIDPHVAVLHNLIHSYFGDGMRLWHCNAFGAIKYDGQTKLGTSKLLVMGEMPLPMPKVTMDHRIAYALLVGAQVWGHRIFGRFYSAWLNGYEPHNIFLPVNFMAEDAGFYRSDLLMAVKECHPVKMTCLATSCKADLISAAKEALTIQRLPVHQKHTRL